MPAATNATPANTPVTFLGKNGKNILIVVNKPDVPYLSDSELDFLTKILTACQLGLGDVAIVNWSRLANPDASALATELGAKDVILFDTPPSLFGLPPATPMYTVMNLASRRFAAAPALTEIEKSREAKQQLWMALKQLFSV